MYILTLFNSLFINKKTLERKFKKPIKASKTFLAEPWKSNSWNIESILSGLFWASQFNSTDAHMPVLALKTPLYGHI